MEKRKLNNWMAENKVQSFSVFVSEDPSLLSEGWRSIEEMNLEMVVFFDGISFNVFVDMVKEYEDNLWGYDVYYQGLNSLESWLKSIEGYTLVGYNSAKAWGVLLKQKYPELDVEHHDLLEIFSDASAEHYGNHARRYDLSNMARHNNVNLKTILLSNPAIKLIADWRKGLFRNTMRNIANQSVVIAKVFANINLKGELYFRDEATGKRVSAKYSQDREPDTIEDITLEEE